MGIIDYKYWVLVKIGRIEEWLPYLTKEAAEKFAAEIGGTVISDKDKKNMEK